MLTLSQGGVSPQKGCAGRGEEATTEIRGPQESCCPPAGLEAVPQEAVLGPQDMPVLALFG